jgi:hypothetical protein
VGNFTQSETGVNITLEKSTNLVSVLYENSSVQPEKHQQQTLNQAGNDEQLLAENGSSLHQYSNGTARRSEAQLQHHVLNNTAIDTNSINSEDTTRNLDTHYLLNIARRNVQEGTDLSSAGTTTSSLPSQSLENTTVSVKLYDIVMLSSRSLHTSDQDVEVSDDSLRNSSNTNDANLTANLQAPEFFSIVTSTENSTTPFPDLNRNIAEDFKPVTQATEGTTHEVPSDSSEHFSKRHTTKFPDRQQIMSLMPEKLYTATVLPGVSFLSSETSETKNQANTPENTSPSHSESSAKSTTSAGNPSLFYSASANSDITTESSPVTTPVLNYSIESRTMLGTAIHSSNAGFADVPQTSPVPVPSVDYSVLSLVTVPTSIPSISNSTTESWETWVTHTTPVAPSAEAITSNTISTTEPSPETINSRKISNTEQSTANVTSSKDKTTLYPVTTFDNTSLLEVVSESTVSSSVPSEENISSRGILSSVQSVETTSIISSSAQSPENATLGLISATVPSQATVTSNTIFSALPSTETVTSGTISTFFSTVPSLSYQMPTRDTIQGNKLQTDISGKNKSSDSIEEELKKSFTTESDKSKTTTLNDTCEKMFCKSEKLTNTKNKKDPLIIVFKSEMEVAEWFLIWDLAFRKHISNALTKNKDIQEKWNKTFSPENILYVTPGPFANGINLTMCILVKVSAQDEENMFLSGEYLQKFLEELTPNLKEMLHLEITDTSIGILTPQHHQCRLQERGGNQMTVTIAMIVTTVIFTTIIVALILIMKCQQPHQGFEAPTGLSYRLPSHSSGQHLATDEECIAMEGRNSQLQEVKEEKANGSTPQTSKASANVKLISKEEHEKKLEVYSSGRTDPPTRKNSKMESKEDIVMVQLHKAPSVYHQ